jgi:hypothetical protein
MSDLCHGTPVREDQAVVAQVCDKLLFGRELKARWKDCRCHFFFFAGNVGIGRRAFVEIRSRKLTASLATPSQSVSASYAARISAMRGWAEGLLRGR